MGNKGSKLKQPPGNGGPTQQQVGTGPNQQQAGKGPNQQQTNPIDGDTSGAGALGNTKKNRLKGVGGVAEVLGLGLLLGTGLFFLPDELLDKLADSLFGFLPEEYRVLALSAMCSFSCCCCCACLFCIFLSMRGGGGGGGNV